MPRFSIFLVEHALDGTLKPQSGITSAFLQPQPDLNSANPSTKTTDSYSVVLTQSVNNPGQWYADITNQNVRYDLYINTNKQDDFSGASGFEVPASKSIYIKRGVDIGELAVGEFEVLTTGSGKLTTPDGGQTWPKFSSSNLPAVFIFEPSSIINNIYVYRAVKLTQASIQVVGGNLLFNVSLDPNGPEMSHYYCDIMIVLI